MRNGNKKKDYCVFLNQENKGKNLYSDKVVVSHSFHFHRSFLFLVIGIVILSANTAGFAQLIFEPMELVFEESANKVISTELKITNSDPDSNYNLSLKTIELSQRDDGEYDVIDLDPNSKFDYQPGYDLSRLSSCKDWITLKQTEVTILPLESVIVDLQIRVNRGKKGFYGAGILVTLDSYATDTNFAVVPRFLVPVLMQIGDYKGRSNIQLKDASLEFVPSQGIKPSTSLVKLHIENNGQTLSSVLGVVRLWAQHDDYLEKITTHELAPKRLIPGADVNLESDILHSLPKGKYQLSAYIRVDGRRMLGEDGRIDKIIDFVGDPEVTRVATDAALDLDIANPEIIGPLGSSRTIRIKVHNTSDGTLNVQCAFGVPKDLIATTLNGVLGKDLTCNQWLTVEPSTFTLEGFEDETIKITANIPETAVDYPWHYALLSLQSTYQVDGQRAGTTEAKICVGEKNVCENIPPDIQGKVPTISDSEPEKSRYLIVASFLNNGLVHKKPIRCRAAVASTVGRPRPMASISLNTTRQGIMLPFEEWTYSGIIDLSGITESGNYQLESSLEYIDNDALVRERVQRAVQITVNGNRKELKMINIDPSEFVEVVW